MIGYEADFYGRIPVSDLMISCPQCRKKTRWEGNEYRPFCSDRCRTTDLGHWASEEYRIPVPAADNIIPFPELDPEKES
jgi:endogenous inhibitor of DNA gyrase (YacG/DUF329 family)